MIILNKEKIDTIKEKLNDIKDVKKTNIEKDILSKKEDLENYYKSIGLDFTAYNNNCNSAIDYYDRLNDMVEYNIYNNIYVYNLNDMNEVYTFFKDITNVMYISNLLIRYLNKEDKVNWFKNHLALYEKDIKFIDENILISTIDLSRTLQRL